MTDIKNGISSVATSIWNNFKNSIESIGDSLSEFFSNFAQILHDIFIPDTDELKGSIDSMKTKINTAFGINEYDLSDILGVSTEVGDVTGTVSVYGLGDVSGKFYNKTYLVNAVTTFRPYIRGFLVLLMVWFNIRQFFGLFHIDSISQSGKSDDQYVNMSTGRSTKLNR